jgi:hypothetical protein
MGGHQVRRCTHCWRWIRRSTKIDAWVHDHSSRVACDQGHDGHITLAEPDEEATK